MTRSVHSGLLTSVALILLVAIGCVPQLRSEEPGRSGSVFESDAASTIPPGLVAAAIAVAREISLSAPKFQAAHPIDLAAYCADSGSCSGSSGPAWSVSVAITGPDGRLSSAVVILTPDGRWVAIEQ